VPVVSAVGHEVDVTLTDMVADARAATPSQAAEMLVPDAHAQRQALFQLRGRMLRAVRSQLVENRAALGALRVAFAHFRLTIAEQEQKLDELGQRLEQAMGRGGARRRAEMERLYRRLSARHPRAVLAGSRAALGPLEVRLQGAARARMTRARSRLSERVASLDAMSPLAVLARGYAIATSDSGKAIRQACEVAPGQKVSIRVHKGSFSATVDSAPTDTPVQDSRSEEPS
jgi:exodeoxyribonuclease VII large subunit